MQNFISVKNPTSQAVISFFAISGYNNPETTFRVSRETTVFRETIATINPMHPTESGDMIDMNIIFIIVFVAALTIIFPTVILIFRILRRGRRAVKETSQHSMPEILPNDLPDHVYHDINERNVLATNDNADMVNAALDRSRMTSSDSYQSLSNAIVSVQVYQSIGDYPISSSQEGAIEMQRSNYEPLSRRNIVESDNEHAYEQV